MGRPLAIGEHVEDINGTTLSKGDTVVWPEGSGRFGFTWWIGVISHFTDTRVSIYAVKLIPGKTTDPVKKKSKTSVKMLRALDPALTGGDRVKKVKAHMEEQDAG